MINKKTYSINEDHKVLHKVGKRWVTVSTLLLGLIGGATMVAHGASADTITPVQHPNTNTIKANLNHQLAHANQPQSNTSANVTVATKSSNSANAITNQAQQMHRGLMLDSPRPTKTTPSSASASAEPSSNSNISSSNLTKSSSNDNDMNTLQLGTRSQQARGWNYVQNGVRNHDDDNYKPKIDRPKISFGAIPDFKKNQKQSKSATNSQSSKPKVMFGDMPNAQSNKKQLDTIKSSNIPWIYDNGKYISSDDVTDWKNGRSAVGFKYRYSPTYNAVEFTSGQYWFSDTRNFAGSANSDIKNATSISFDNNVNTSNISDMSGMFESDGSLLSLNFGGFDTSNVRSMNYMFRFASNLKALTFGRKFDTRKARNLSDMSDMFQDRTTSDSGIHILTIQSPNTVLPSNIIPVHSDSGGQSSDWYREINGRDKSGIPYTETNPTDISNTSNGNNVGTFYYVANPFDVVKYVYNKKVIGSPQMFDGSNIPSDDVIGRNNTSGTIESFNWTSDMFTYPNYHVSQSDRHDINQGLNDSTTYIHVEPNLEINTINFSCNGFPNGSTKIQGLYGTSITNSDINKIKNSIPNGYQLTSNDNLQNIKYNNPKESKPLSLSIKPVPMTTDNITFVKQLSPNDPNEYVPVSQMIWYGKVGANVELEPSNLPSDLNGYSLVDKNKRSFTLGSSDGNHTFVVESNKSTNDNIPAVPNTVNIKGTVTLHFSDNGKTKNIPLDYLIQDSDASKVNVLSAVDYNKGTNTTPSDFLNQIIQGFDTSNFTYNGSKTAGDYTPSQSDTTYNHGSTKLLTHDVTLNFTNKPNTDPIAKQGSNDTVVYVDNGKTISSDVINGPTGTWFTPSVNNVPKGYQLVNSNQKFLHNGTTHTVDVIGATIPSTDKTSITVNVHEDGNQTPTSSSTIPLANKHIGDTVTIYPNNYTPQNYAMANSDVPVTATIVSNGNGGYNLQYNQPGIKNNDINYNYNYDSANATNPITINYVNQSGKTVGTKTYKVPSGSNVDPSSDIPKGYVNNKSNTKVPATNSPQTITFNVIGKPASQLSKYTNKGMVNLHIVEQKDGHAFKSYNIVVDESQKDIGSDFTIMPSSVNPDTKVFQPDSADKTITGLVTDNGAITDSGTDTFVYNTITKPVHINFLTMLGSLPQVTINGGKGTPITSSDVPHGYHLPSDAHYHFNSDGQIVDSHNNIVPDNKIQLEGNDIQGKANIVLEYQVLDPTGKNVVKTIYNKADDAQVILNGQVGGSQTINPWRYWKQDFTLPQSVQGQSDKIQFTPSDDNANDEHGQQFNPTLVFTSKARQAGDVVVRYVDTDTGKPIMINGKADTQDIKNDTGDLIGQEIELGQSGANKDVAIDNDSNVRYVLNVPDGYHLEYNSNPITLQEAVSNASAPSNATPQQKHTYGVIRSFGMFYHRPVGMVLTVGLSRPSAKKPATSGTSTDSGSIINPSGSASASGSATMPNIPVVPPTNTTNNYNYSDNGNSTNTTNNYYDNGSSKSTNANSGSSVIPSDTAVNKAKNTTPNAPVNHASDNKAIPSDSTVTTNTKGADATNGKATKHTNNKSDSKPSKSKNSQSGIVSGKNINRPSKAQNRPNKTVVNKHVRHNHVDRNNENKTAEPSVAKATATGASANVANDNYDDYTNATASPVAPISVSAPRVNVATNTTNNHGKLPQTGDSNKIAGMASVIMLLASISLAGADLDRKHRLN